MLRTAETAAAARYRCPRFTFPAAMETMHVVPSFNEIALSRPCLTLYWAAESQVEMRLNQAQAASGQLSQFNDSIDSRGTALSRAFVARKQSCSRRLLPLNETKSAVRDRVRSGFPARSRKFNGRFMPLSPSVSDCKSRDADGVDGQTHGG
jgi:hypothetical protein